MAVSIAINGFGRIGRAVLRLLIEGQSNDIKGVAVTEPAPAETGRCDQYRACAALLSVMPTLAGAARRISQVLPQLTGRLKGPAVHVPSPNVSLVDLGFMPDNPVARDENNAAAHAMAAGELAGISAYAEHPPAAVAPSHEPHSFCSAADQTSGTKDGLVRIVIWYAKEWGFSNRMIDAGCRMGELLRRVSQLRMAG